MAKKDGAPIAQSRPGFSFSIGSRRTFPSKWDDAEKWVVNGLDSPVLGTVKPANFMLKQCGVNGSLIKQDEKDKETEGSVFQELKGVGLECRHGSSDRGFSWVSDTESSDVFLKDKLTNEVEPNYSKINRTGTMEVVQEVKNRDTGTEMTPGGSSTASRCPTPLKSLSPPRHNTPESRLALKAGRYQLECHLADKLQPWTPFDAINCKWSSMEDEEEEISKSLRHFEMNNEFVDDNISGPRPSAWEEKELSEPCLRYQIKEAKIKAWVNLQKAKAEEQSRKLEVKIQKMRSKHEEKTMKKMEFVRRKAEELRTAALLDHTDTVAKSKKTPNQYPNVQFSGHPCGCLISNR